MENKQQELNIFFQKRKYDLVVITENWQDDIHDLNARVEGYTKFKMNRPPLTKVALFVKETFHVKI